MNESERSRRLRAHFAETLHLAQKAAAVLADSIQRIGSAAAIDSLATSTQGRDTLESLSARFARLSGLLVQQVFRLADRLKDLEEGTPVDRLNRAEKRSWIESAQVWREIRELRNRISHEYAEEVWLDIVREAYRLAPALLDCVVRVGRDAGD